MREIITLIENAQRLYYHGSHTALPVGTVLKGRAAAYEGDWGSTSFYAALERYRPPEMISHRDAVFMCDNDEDVDLAGGSTDWLFVVRPLGRVERHDINWGSAISVAVDEDADETVIAQYARYYWEGIPHESGESVWEYLTTEAEIMSVEEF